jgi:glycosyltransferase involved in cell wall biosynthesis
MRDIWFWQRIVSPHMAELAVALARLGCRVTYLAQDELSDDRRRLGWAVPGLEGVRLRMVSRQSAVACLEDASQDSIHLCQGLWRNGYIRNVQSALAARGMRQWVLMETVDDDGCKGLFKRSAYAAIVRNRCSYLNGLLALGGGTPAWVVARGMPAERVFSFAYFLRDVSESQPADALFDNSPEHPFRVAFVGQFVDRKRFPLLVDALAHDSRRKFELLVVGGGPRELEWRAYAERRLAGRVRWIGKLPSLRIASTLRGVDCLVLPSRHDGWGAVISEALLAGTPAICSDRCGAAEVVRASAVGGVFPTGDVLCLARLLAGEMDRGNVSPIRREQLAEWARCLGASAGAKYLIEILAHADGQAPRPTPPWGRGFSGCAV